MSKDQGLVYADFIATQLQAEGERRRSLDERAGKLQQSAGVSTALFATALGLVIGGSNPIQGLPLTLFSVMVVCFLLAFLCAVIASRLINYEVADAKTLHLMVDDHWSDSEASSRNITAWLNAKAVEGLRPGNNSKARWLLGGLVLQGLGVVAGAGCFILTVVPTLVS